MWCVDTPAHASAGCKAFNEYLASDGVTDMLESGKRSNELNKPSHERYSKHVKTVIQVGNVRGIVRVRTIVDGRSVAKQLVIA